MDEQKENKNNRTSDAAKNLVKKQAKRLVKRSLATAALATSPIWGFFALFFLIIFFVFLAVLIPTLPGQDPNNPIAAIPTPTIAPTGPFPTVNPTGPVPPPPDCPLIDQRLTRDFNIRLVNIRNCEKKALLFTAVYRAYSHTGFRFRMGGTELEFRNTHGGRCGSAPVWLGCVPNSTGKLITLDDFDLPSRATPGVWNYIISHELFHIFAARNPGIYGQYPHDDFSSSDARCYRPLPSGGFIFSTYVLNGRAKSESFAESGALYLIDKSPLSGRIPSYRSYCQNNLKWFNQYVF